MNESPVIFAIRLFFAAAFGAAVVWLVIRKVNDPSAWTFHSLAVRFGRLYRWVVGVHSVLVFFFRPIKTPRQSPGCGA